jgi:hypothetical protein
MARTTGVVPNRLSGEAAPNTLGGVGAAGPPGLASAPGGGRMAAISRVPARRLGAGCSWPSSLGPSSRTS